MENLNRFSEKEARVEADEMTALIEKGDAKDYSDAEKIITEGKERFEKIRLEFADDILEILNRIDNNFHLSPAQKSPEHLKRSIGVNDNGEVNGYLNDFEITYYGTRVPNSGTEKEVLWIHKTAIFEVIAFILKKKGVKVYKYDKNFIVVIKPKDGYKKDAERLDMRVLARGHDDDNGYISSQSDGRFYTEYIRSDGEFSFKNEELYITYQGDDFGPRLIKEFDKSEEEIIEYGNQTFSFKERVDTNKQGMGVRWNQI